MPQLDGLRGIAVLAVLASHWIPQANRFGHVGLAGVYVFFVLSGFLITSVLLEARGAREAGKVTLGGALRTFFGRRVLRIFPAYYFALIGSVLAWPTMFSADLPWNLAYLGNMRAVMLGRTTSINHFWSLAVEEQFYLFWPFVVLLLPRRDLFKAIALAVAISPMWRCAAIAMGWRHIVYSYPVWSNLDSIGLGALLAVSRRSGPDEARTWDAWVPMAGQLGGILWAACAIATNVYLGSFRLSRPGPIYAAIFVVYPLAVSLAGVYVVARAARAGAGSRDVLAKVLASRPLRAVGVISYGVYVYHFFVQGLIDLASIHFTGRELPTVPRLFVLLATTLAFAALSWFVLEKPARSLGQRLRRQAI
jgi:peptidoglycan/LPS O-acetylase OafA/YrhL